MKKRNISMMAALVLAALLSGCATSPVAAPEEPHAGPGLSTVTISGGTPAEKSAEKEESTESTDRIIFNRVDPANLLIEGVELQNPIPFLGNSSREDVEEEEEILPDEILETGEVPEEGAADSFVPEEVFGSGGSPNNGGMAHNSADGDEVDVDAIIDAVPAPDNGGSGASAGGGNSGAQGDDDAPMVDAIVD